MHRGLALLNAMADLHYPKLAKRLGPNAFEKRMTREAQHEAAAVSQSLAWLQNFHTSIADFFHGIGLYNRGYRNALDIQVVENRLLIPHLPCPFKGFRLLQLSDLHLDIDKALSQAIVDKISTLDYDLAVITGDFRCRTIEAYMPAIEATRPLAQALKTPIFAVLGNHDPLAIVSHLEAMGIHFLLNEAVRIEHRGSHLWLCGVDDPHFYQSHDLAKVASQFPINEAHILLAHAPEIAQEAGQMGFRTLLCGHTHGGQICLPGGFALATNLGRLKNRRLIAGNWQWGALQGYTSRGTGCCGVPLRFNAPAEITLHILEDAR